MHCLDCERTVCSASPSESNSNSPLQRLGLRSSCVIDVSYSVSQLQLVNIAWRHHECLCSKCVFSVIDAKAECASLRRYSQFWPRLWGWKELGGVRRHANEISLGLIWGGILGVAITTTLVLSSGNTKGNADAEEWAWIDVVRIDFLSLTIGLLMQPLEYFD